MLDNFEVLTTSGVVLWSKSFAPVSANIINGFIKDVFIEQRLQTGPNEASAAKNPPYKREKYSIRWTSAKDLGLIFVVSCSEPLGGVCSVRRLLTGIFPRVV